MKQVYYVAIVLFFSNVMEVYAQNVDSGDIPENRLAISGWVDIKFNDSGNWQTVDVTTKGVRPNTGNDMAPAIERMIQNGNGKTIYKFPAGSYKINSTINIKKSDFQVIGVGNATKFLFKGGNNAPTWFVDGDKGRRYSLSNTVRRGDDQIVLTNSSGLSVGDYVFIAQQNGERTRDLDNQIVKILSKSGNTLTVDMKIGLDFVKSKATVEKANLRKNIKFSNFYMERTSQPNEKVGQLEFSWVQNAEVSNIESKKVLISHFKAENCRDMLFFQNNAYGNFGFDRTGSYQYGITLNCCTRINVINNKLSDLRHHIALQFGSNHCVIAYNRATIYNHYADYGQHNSKGCHNNLFEGNFGSELFDDNNRKAWGALHTTWFRNHVIKKIGSEYPNADKHAIIGNEIRAAQSGIKEGNGNGDFFIGANIVNINKENGDGRMVWGRLNANSEIPPSLFLTSKPEYLNKWPLYGPKADLAPNNAPTVSFKDLSGNLTVEEGYDLILEAETNDSDGTISNVKLFIDSELIREEKTAPYEWGHATSPQPDEISGLSVGEYEFKVVATDDRGATSEAVFKLVVQPSLSIGNLNEINTINVTIFPNPSTGLITVEMKDINDSFLTIFDLSGKKLFHQKIIDESMHIDVEFLSQGIYIASISNEKQKMIMRLIKK